MLLRALLFLVCASLPLSASAGALEVLSSEIAKDAARQIFKTKQAISACVYVDDSLAPSGGSISLAYAVAASLAVQYGVSDVLDAGLASLSQAPSFAKEAGCDVAVIIAFEAPSKESRSRVWVLQIKENRLSQHQEPLLSSLGEPFLSSMIRLPTTPPVSLPTDISKGWRMQQISMGAEPIVALLAGEVSTQDGAINSLFALSKGSVVSYRLSKAGTLFSAPKELYRADLSLLPKATKVSRDLTGVLAFDRERCVGDCPKETRYLLLRTSDTSISYRLSLDEGFTRPQALSGDEELNKLWPLFLSDEQKLLFGALEEGSNLFMKKVWWVDPTELSKKKANKLEVPLNERFFAASYGARAKRAAFLQESEEIMLYQSTELAPFGSIGKGGAQILLVDLDGDGSAEVVSTSTEAAGEGDSITISTLDDKAPKKVWGSGTLYPPASAVAGKTRPYSWVTALAAGDIDGDGNLEVIAALYSAAGSSILIISR